MRAGEGGSGRSVGVFRRTEALVEVVVDRLLDDPERVVRVLVELDAHLLEDVVRDVVVRIGGDHLWTGGTDRGNVSEAGASSARRASGEGAGARARRSIAHGTLSGGCYSGGWRGDWLPEDRREHAHCLIAGCVSLSSLSRNIRNQARSMIICQYSCRAHRRGAARELCTGDYPTPREGRLAFSSNRLRRDLRIRGGARAQWPPPEVLRGVRNAFVSTPVCATGRSLAPADGSLLEIRKKQRRLMYIRALRRLRCPASSGWAELTDRHIGTHPVSDGRQADSAHRHTRRKAAFLGSLHLASRPRSSLGQPRLQASRQDPAGGGSPTEHLDIHGASRYDAFFSCKLCFFHQACMGSPSSPSLRARTRSRAPLALHSESIHRVGSSAVVPRARAEERRSCVCLTLCLHSRNRVYRLEEAASTFLSHSIECRLRERRL